MGVYLYGIGAKKINVEVANTASNPVAEDPTKNMGIVVHEAKYITKMYWGWEEHPVTKRTISRYENAPQRSCFVAYEFKEGEGVYHVKGGGNTFSDATDAYLGTLKKQGRKWILKN